MTPGGTPALERLRTGITSLDAMFQGGLPAGSVTIVAGPPGSGKTILAQQICFANARPGSRAVLFNTLSEPTAKTLRYLRQFSYFDPAKLEASVHFVDLGGILRQRGLENAAGMILDELKRSRPALVVIDSFKVFDDLAKSPEELRKFGYEVAVNLMAWECTALLLGEYGERDLESNPIFSVVDGLVRIDQREVAGEQQRFLRVVKMRGTDHSRDEHAFAITANGVELYTPRVTIRRDRDRPNGPAAPLPRARTGLAGLDALVGAGVPRGSSVLVAGCAGAGKTLLALELVYRGAKDLGEKGVFFSFEEPASRLLEGARTLGWDLDALVAQGLVEIDYVPQPEIMVERHLLMMRERIEASGAQRVAVDSLTTFLHKVKDPEVAREKVFQLASIVYNRQALGFFAASIPFGQERLSRFGVEETVLDGVVLLGSETAGVERVRTIEVLKLRNTAHRTGRHPLAIGRGGFEIRPRPEGPAS
ncbi:MAG TPA: ATPase domain-containing protein [Planctomycetota bacterium]|nr:ATPase domain-containing protein [Planctomycetota bacterium]